MGKAPIPPLPSVDAPADMMLAARINCAERLRARGGNVEAAAFERGDRDEAWALRHEINKLRAEGVA